MRWCLRLACLAALAVTLAACDKCGDLNIGVPGQPKACADARPR